MPNPPQKICVYVDSKGKGNANFPIKASLVEGPSLSFELFPKALNCFEYGKSYYMQHFLQQIGNATWYGTTCRFVPYHRHQNKTVSYYWRTRAI